MTRVVKINPQNPNPNGLQAALHALLEGKLVAFPTETVYGLGVNALDPHAVELVSFKPKGARFMIP
jgi:L-threonylcarbamoyladenylate synthase